MKLTKSNFDTEIENNKVSLVDFWAAWCGPCRMLTPTMNELINDYKDESSVCVGKVDTEESPDLAAKYGIRGIPTIIIFKNGKLVERMSGVQSKSFYKDKIDYYLN